jgi:predicted amidohydrolase YtcJ
MLQIESSGLAALALLLLAAADRAAAEPADLVLKNGNVHTLDPRRPRAEAVAVRGNSILAVGTNADVAGLVGLRTRTIDLAGRTLLPGFVDSHAHVMGDRRTRGGFGFVRLGLDLADTKSWDEVLARVRAAVTARRPGEWVLGRGWHEGKWASPPTPDVEGFPTHDALTALSPDNPVLLERADGHAILANAKAMALMGVTAGTKAPPGGEILRDAAGRLSGVFVDNAEALLRPPPAGLDEMRRALEVAMDECLRKGVTSVTDAGADLDTIALYKEYAAAGKLKVRLNVMAGGFDTMRALGRPEIGLGGGLLTLRTVKLFADGAFGSRGAALLEPYDDDPGNVGLVRTPPETIREACRFALGAGFQVAIHAIGDRANRMVLDAYESAFREFPAVKDPRFRVEHAQLLDERDIPRFARLGVIASMQTCHCPSDRPWAAKRVGLARLKEGAYAWRKLLATGARIINGTDSPVEDLSAIQNFFAGMSRRDPAGQPPGGFDPEERMTREETLRSMTVEAAYGSFEEATKGSIEPGKRADLVVLSQDILTVPEDDVLKTEVVATIVDGRVLYEKP